MSEYNQPTGRAFAERILKIAPVNNSVITMANGASGAATGATSSGSQAVMELHRHVIDFAKAYDSPQPDRAAIERLADKVEASLQTVWVLGVLSDIEADDLLTALEQYMAKVAKSNTTDK